MTSALWLTAVLLGSPARAWEHTTQVWSRDDFPVPWYIADNDPASPARDDLPELWQRSFDNWRAGAPCAALEDAYQGIRENHVGGFSYDLVNTMSSRTEEQEPAYLGAGTLGVTLCRGDERAFSTGGTTYYYSDDCDIIMNDDVAWISTADFEDGYCSSQYLFEAVATHEIGHLWGLGHPCEADDVDEGKCEDPALRDATMFYHIDGTCSNEQSSIESDDIEGLYALYGPYCSFQAAEDSARNGGAPLTVCFEAECNAGVSELTWIYGDGATDSGGTEVCHTYTEKGQYTVALTTTGGGEECGEWESTVRERAYVLVCGEPEPSEGFSGLFTYEPDDGLVYQMINQTDTTVYGCVDRIQWDVFKGTDTSGEPIESVGAWSPKIEFPAEGTYTVVLNVGGPGGIAADSLEIEVEEVGSGTCAMVPVSTGLLGIGVALGAALRRRRQG